MRFLVGSRKRQIEKQGEKKENEREGNRDRSRLCKLVRDREEMQDKEKARYKGSKSERRKTNSVRGK